MNLHTGWQQHWIFLLAFCLVLGCGKGPSPSKDRGKKETEKDGSSGKKDPSDVEKKVEVDPRMVKVVRQLVKNPAAVGLLKKNRDRAIPALLQELKGGDEKLRRHVLIALGQLRPMALSALPTLGETLLNDPSPVVRQAAAAILGGWGEKSASQVEALVKALGDKVASVRQGAAYALALVQVDRPEVINGLMSTLATDRDPLARRQAAFALGKLSQNYTKPISALVGALGDRSIMVRTQAAKSLGELGKRVGSTLPYLVEKLVKDPSSRVRGALVVTIHQLGKGTPEVIEGLVKTIRRKGENDIVLRFSFRALGSFGAKSKPAVPTLFHHARTSRFDDVRVEAVEALLQIDPNREVIKLVKEFLHHKKKKFPYGISRGLGKTRGAPQWAVDLLETLLSSDDRKIQFHAVRSLGQLGKGAGGVQEKLAKMAGDAKYKYLHRALRKALDQINEDQK